MPGKAVPVRIGDTVVLVEAAPVAGSELTAARSGKAAKAADGVIDAFEGVRDTIVALAVGTVETIEAAAARAVRPDHVEVTFGLKLTVEGTVIVAGAAAEVRGDAAHPPPPGLAS